MCIYIHVFNMLDFREQISKHNLMDLVKFNKLASSHPLKSGTLKGTRISIKSSSHLLVLCLELMRGLSTALYLLWFVCTESLEIDSRGTMRHFEDIAFEKKKEKEKIHWDRDLVVHQYYPID